MPTREQVGARQSFLGQLRAIRTAADLACDRLETSLDDGFRGEGHDTRILIHVDLHVLVLLDHLENDVRLRERRRYAIAHAREEHLARLDTCFIEAADEHLERSLGNFTLEIVRVQVSLATLGGLGCRLVGQGLDDSCHGTNGVDHLPLGVAGVAVVADDREGREVSVECLAFNLTDFAAVEGIGGLHAELREIEMGSTHTDLFVGRERHTDGGARDVRIRQQHLDGGHDFGDARLIIRAQQGGAVAGDDVLPDVSLQHGVTVPGDHLGMVAGQHEVGARIVVPPDHRLHVRAARFRRRVDVRQETDGRQLGGLVGRQVRRQRREDVAPLVHGRIGEAQRLQFVDQQPQQGLLLLGRGVALRSLNRLGVHAHVAHEPFEHAFAWNQHLFLPQTVFAPALALTPSSVSVMNCQISVNICTSVQMQIKGNIFPNFFNNPIINNKKSKGLWKIKNSAIKRNFK